MFSDMELGMKIALLIGLVALIYFGKDNIFKDSGKGGKGGKKGGSDSSGSSAE